MSFQFLNPAPVFFDLPGAEPLAGGFLQFYDKGTTTPRDTWSDEARTVLNPNPVPLDAAGRAEFAIWLDGEYSVKAESAAGETIWTRDYTSGQTAGATIPPLQQDRWLTNDGVSMSWGVLRQLPDPTGFADQALVTDGANFLFRPFPTLPEIPDPDIKVTIAPLSFRAGLKDESTKFYIEAGSGSAPASGSNTTQAVITLATPFAGVPVITVTPTAAQGGSGGYLPSFSIIAKSAANFTIKFDTNAGTDSGGRINNSIAFDYIAFGTLSIAP